MSLVTCAECGHRVSTLAAACPNCGCPPCQEATASNKIVPPALPANQSLTSRPTKVPTVPNSSSVASLGAGASEAIGPPNTAPPPCIEPVRPVLADSNVTSTGTSADTQGVASTLCRVAAPPRTGETGKGKFGLLPRYFWWSILLLTSVVAAPIGLVLALIGQRDARAREQMTKWTKLMALIAIVWAAFFNSTALTIFLIAASLHFDAGSAAMAWTSLALDLIVVAWLIWKHKHLLVPTSNANQLRPSMALNDVKTESKAHVSLSPNPTEDYWTRKVPYWHVLLAIFTYSVLFRAGCYDKLTDLLNGTGDPPNYKTPASPSWPRLLPPSQQRSVLPPVRDATGYSPSAAQSVNRPE